MKLNDSTAALDIYALLNNAGTSYAPLNKILSHYRYTALIMPLDEFERKFRTIFGLPPYINQQQRTRVIIVDADNNCKSIHITRQLFEKLSKTISGATILNHGYIPMLRKSFRLFSSGNGSMDFSEVQHCKEIVQKFSGTLEHALRLAGYNHFHIKEFFTHEPLLKRVIPAGDTRGIAIEYSSAAFSAKDNYFVRLYLESEQKLQPHSKLAAELYSEAFNYADQRSRFLNFVSALEACFNNRPKEIPDLQALAKYIYVLAPNRKEDYVVLYEHLYDFFRLKKLLAKQPDIAAMQGTATIDAIDISTKWVEPILREILRKIIKLNHIHIEMLLPELEMKFKTLVKQNNRKQAQ